MGKKTPSISSFVITVLIIVNISFFAISCTKAQENIEPQGNAESDGSGEGENIGLTPNIQTLLDNQRSSDQQRSTTRGSIIEIRERMFATQITDIYLNANDYLEKTLRLQGIFKVDRHEGEDPINSVIRYSPGGCCGNDGLVGFEVKWAKDNAGKFPSENSWVEATGVLKQYGIGFFKYLYIELSSLTVLETRGAEFVRQ